MPLTTSRALALVLALTSVAATSASVTVPQREAVSPARLRGPASSSASAAALQQRAVAAPARVYGPPTLPWAFNWSTLQVFAFPGAAPRFMTAAEVNYFEANFQTMLTWGLNSTCFNGTGAACAKSECYCDRAHPETQRFVPTMEASLQLQGTILKARRAVTQPGVYFPVFGYLESLSAQQYYLQHQKILYDDAYASWRLATEAKGVIDCYRDSCNWQGTEYRQFDLRQPAVRDYYVYEVVGGIINGTGLDGTFMDVIDWWSDSCVEWKCTDAERADLVGASLLALEQVLKVYQNKVFSVSSHTSLLSNVEYYMAQLAILKEAGNAIRFWEFFTVADIPSLLYEAQTFKVPLHVHVTARTLAPDWVELAAVLLGYSDHTVFSYSGPWMLDSFDVYPEYTKPLGRPLGDAVSSSTNVTVPAWGLLEAQNLVYSWPSGPFPNASIPGALAFLGSQPSTAACLALVRANASFTAMTYVNSTADPEWGTTCWGRLDAVDWQSCLESEASGAPCYANAEATIVSAVNAPVVVVTTTYTRSFEHLDVTLVTASAAGGTTATLAWH